MDGRFVPEITMGPLAARAVRGATRLPIDVHLMIVEPDRHLDAFARAGATSIAVHVEACPHLYLTLQQIASLGMRPSVALNPATPPEQIAYVLPLVSMVLVMTVEPGEGGQAFIPAMLAKVRALAERRAVARPGVRDRSRRRDPPGQRGRGRSRGRDRARRGDRGVRRAGRRRRRDRPVPGRPPRRP